MPCRLARDLWLRLQAVPFWNDARLWALSQALDVPVGYFYDGLTEAPRRTAPADHGADGGEMFARKETMDPIRAYYQLSERPRRRLLDLAKSLHDDTDQSDVA